ncbi:hypothetical protein EVAR_11853_1 [Eumeta japonica]|uniref:Uncharacterized protein n=1 Tax=Eumeta variegata TaxID=151549 RepID=A0A4C1U7Q9_EUMVA|nr:hypothetical protein EVAR_11853_1 [Eumeta japonica]
MVFFETHALRLLAPEQLALLVQYVHTMRMQRLQLIKRTETEEVTDIRPREARGAVGDARALFCRAF